MNFKKAGIFRRISEESEQQEVQNDSGGMLAVWGSPGSGKTVTAVKIAKMLSAKKKNVILLLCDMTAPMLPCICSPDELECERSLGNILAAARIGENLIKHIFVEHFEGGNSMKAERTLAVQIPAELFDRLKEYLVAHNLKQKQFLIQLIESALEDTEKE